MTPEEKIKNLDRLLGSLVMALNNIADFMDKSGELSRTGEVEDFQSEFDELSKSCFAAAVISKNLSVIIKEVHES